MANPFDTGGVYTYVDVSTAHINDHDRGLIATNHHCISYPEGAWVWTSLDEDAEYRDEAWQKEGYSIHFVHICNLAAQQGYAFVRFDADGRTHDNFPTME